VKIILIKLGDFHQALDGRALLLPPVGWPKKNRGRLELSR
jgi:hypothetical protein